MFYSIFSKVKFLTNYCNIGRKVCSLFKFAIIVPLKEYGDDFNVNAAMNNICSLSTSFMTDGKVKYTFGTKEVLFPGEAIDFCPKLVIPYNDINKFLQNSNFEIILWYEGGYKRYKYSLQEETFEEITE